MPELIRTFQRGSFRLDTFDTHKTDRNGKARLGYRFKDSRMGDKPVFEGYDFFCSPLHAIDSDATVACVLSFLSLGGTDPEYFEDERQVDWRNQHAEELGCILAEIEDAIEQAKGQGGSDAIYIDLADNGTLDTVFAVFDCMTGLAWTESFSEIERDDDGPTADALACVREEIADVAWERREIS